MSAKEKARIKVRKLAFDQTIPQEIANSITHGIGALLSIAAIVLLVIFSANRGSALRVVSFIIFGTTMFLTFISSTLYHALRPPKAKILFLRFDHIAIYWLIAGTYTPLVLVTIGGWLGWTIFGVIWGIAIMGTLSKIFLLGTRMDKISMALYITMGWLIIFFIKILFIKLPFGGLVFLFSGGISYTLGTFFFMFNRIPFSHAIWHLFVIGGAICHFFCMLFYV